MKPTHFERLIRRKIGGLPNLSWQCKEVKDLIAIQSREMTYLDYGINIIETLVRKNANIPATLGFRAAEQGALPTGWPMAQIAAEYATYMFQAEGKQIFEVKPTLAQLLLDTELDIDTELFKLPYRAFYLEVPKGLFRVWNSITEWHDIEGIYVVEDPSWSERELERLGRRDTGMASILRERGCEPDRCLRVVVAGAAKCEELINGVAVEDDAIFHFRIDLGPGKLSSYFDVAAEMAVRKRAGFDVPDELREETVNNPNIDDIPTILRFVANTILYINSSGADLTSAQPLEWQEEIVRAKQMGRGTSKGKRCADRAFQKYTSLPRIVLGAKLKPLQHQPTDIKSWRLKSRFRVRGSWRTFTSERYVAARGKTIWVMPFWKGPEMSNEISRRYQVGEE